MLFPITSLSQAQKCSPRSHRLLEIGAATQPRVPRARVPLSYGSPQLICRRGPPLKKTGEFMINDSGRRAEGTPAGGELSHLGWRPVLNRSSETFIVLCDPVHHVLGYSAPHFFRESAHLFSACTPMSRIIIGHDSGPGFPIRRTSSNVLEKDVDLCSDVVCRCVVDIFFQSEKSTPKEENVSADL
jgi:hypothetical protein